MKNLTELTNDVAAAELLVNNAQTPGEVKKANKALKDAKKALSAYDDKKLKMHKNRLAAKNNALVMANSLLTEAKTAAEILEGDNLKNADVTDLIKVVFSVSQPGKNPCTISQTVYAPRAIVTLDSVTRKISHAIAESMHKQAAAAILAHAKYGRYITAFRPKSAFIVEVNINGVTCLHFTETKGADCIKVVDSFGALIPKNAIVDKMQLIAGMTTDVAQKFAAAVSFDGEIERIEKSLIIA